MRRQTSRVSFLMCPFCVREASSDEATQSKAALSSCLVFLMADAVGCAVAGQPTPNGYYNLAARLRGRPARR
jgi:hypothetical protein